jgi:hypothetical protein
MCSTRDNVALPTLGFPIRASAGHWPFSASPRLIAAVHALHRLLVPRHPPCALTILTVIGESLRDSLTRNLAISRGSLKGDSRSEKSARISPQGKAKMLCPDTRVIGYCVVFKVREEAPPDGRSGFGLSKLNSMLIASPAAFGNGVRSARSGRHS